MPTELSLHNPRFALLRELRTPRGRREQCRFAIEGPTMITEALRSGLTIRELYATCEALAQHPIMAQMETPALPVFTLPERAFGRVSDLESPAGLLAILDLPTPDPTALFKLPGSLLLLAGMNDPGNAGTLLRSAEAFGVAAALFGRGGVDSHAPKVVRASMGSVFRLPVATIDAVDFIAAALEAGRPIIAADTDGVDIADVEFPPHAVLAVGNERRGVRDWLPRWDTLVRIPQRGQAESLNAAVAGSILLYVAMLKS